MRKILQKIAWKTNNWTAKFSLLTIYLGGDHHKFGFQFLNIDNGIAAGGIAANIANRVNKKIIS